MTPVVEVADCYLSMISNGQRVYLLNKWNGIFSSFLFKITKLTQIFLVMVSDMNLVAAEQNIIENWKEMSPTKAPHVGAIYARRMSRSKN